MLDCRRGERFHNQDDGLYIRIVIYLQAHETVGLYDEGPGAGTHHNRAGRRRIKRFQKRNKKRPSQKPKAEGYTEACRTNQ